MRRDALLLEDIVAAADGVADFIAGYTAETLASNPLVRSAVLHQLTVIGEAVARLSDSVRNQHPEIPWTDITGLRNVVVHNYFGIDWAEVPFSGGHQNQKRFARQKPLTFNAMPNKPPKTGVSRAAKPRHAQKRRRTRKLDDLALLDPFATLAPLREGRIVKAISESTKDFITGRYEP